MSTTDRTEATDLRRQRDVPQFDLEADVVVVGLGAAGACAALEAVAAGADTLVLERASGGGGTSALSGGLIYIGGGTRVQRACGYEDTAEDMYRYLMAATGPEPDEAKIRLYCDESVSHFEWLCQSGVVFKDSFYPEPNMESPTDDCLVFSGGEDSHPFTEIARPAPRGHKPQAKAAAGGALMQSLIATLDGTAARTVVDARCETLIVDEDDTITGVVARIDGAEQCIRARRGVVLTSGGFVMNPDMIRAHAPLAARCSFKVGQDNDDGRGIRMGMAAGGAAVRMDALEVAVPLSPPHRLMRGVLVNGHGLRFINEDTYYGRVGQESLFRQDGEMYLIVDTDIYEKNHTGMEASWVEESIPELGASIGLPAGVLESTIGYYNEHAVEGRDPLFHKRQDMLKPLTTPPYAAIDWRIDKSIYATFTLGGLHTSVDGEVLDPDGRKIPGLYAAGRTTSGLPAWGYSSGLSLADATYFGRRAGRAASKR